MEKKKIKDKKLPVGFTFSFPCRQSRIDEVRRSGIIRLPRHPRGEMLRNPFPFSYWMVCVSCIFFFFFPEAFVE